MKLKVSKVTDSDKYYLFNLDNPQEKADFELLSSITEASHAKEIDKDVDYEARVPQEFNCITIFQKLGGIAKATAVDEKDVYVEVSHGLPVGYDLAQLYFPIGALRRQADNSTKFVIQQYADGKPLFKAGYPRTTLAANAYSAGAYNPDNHTSIFDTLDVRELECSVCGKARKNRKNFNVFKGFSNQEVVMVGNECYSEFRQNHVANTDVISSLGKLEQLEEHMAQYEKPVDFLSVLKQKAEPEKQFITRLTQMVDYDPNFDFCCGKVTKVTHDKANRKFVWTIPSKDNAEIFSITEDGQLVSEEGYSYGINRDTINKIQETIVSHLK